MALPLNPRRALLNQDVVYAVLEHLAIPDASWYDYDAAPLGAKSRDDAGERRGALASCTRVCRSFLFPAVSVLWRNLGSLETLYAVEQRHASQNAEVAVSIGLSWLPTYSQYSRWVRAVHNPSPSLTKESLQPPTPNRGLHIASLPRLTHLRWIQQVPGTTEFLRLLSPSLRSLHVIFRNTRSNATRYEHQTFVQTLLLQAAERAPNLTYLRITRASGIPEAWLLSVDQFAGLEVLDILEPSYDEVTTCGLLPRLAAMESLRSLKLRLPATTTYSAPDLAKRRFPALRDLHLDCKYASLPDAITLLRSISSPYLESVRIEECECPTASLSANLLELCAVLNARFAPTLRAVSLSVTPIGPPVVFERPLVEYLEPLLRIRELGSFELSISRTAKNASMPVPESNLAAIAEAWPHLTRLHLNYVPVASEGPPSVGALLVFARGCPELTSLDLPCIDARGVEALSPELDHPHFSLTSCSVLDGGWDGLIPDPEGLAQFLKALFPNATLGRQRLEAEMWRRTVESRVALTRRLFTVVERTP